MWPTLPRIHPAVVAVPLWLLFFGLALFSAQGDSPTMDEQNHLARGAALVWTGDPRLSVEHPPVGNGLSGLMLLLEPGLRLPTDHESWTQTDGWYAFADQFLWFYGADVSRIIFLGRLAMIFLTLGLSLIGYRLARRLWGRKAALLSLGFLLFDPNILAHGRYVTTDVAGATGLLLALLLLHRLWTPAAFSLPRLLWAAFGLAICWGTKLSNLAFVPILALLALLPLLEWDGRQAGRNLLAYGLAGLLSLPILWLFFGLEWGSFRFAGDVTALLSLNDVRGPMPTFWQGVERMVLLGSGSGRTAFLLGETNTEGFRLYFPIAFLVKTPLLTTLALPVAAVLLLRQRQTRPAALFLLIPAVAFFAIMLTNSLNIGYRHLLPLLPLIYVLISGLASAGTIPAPGRPLTLAPRLLPLALVWALLAASLAIHPHYLSYFNILAGGPENGYNILIDSNVDWGQDLLRLQTWMAENGVESVKLGWFGSARPEYYGLNYEPLPGLPYNFHLFWEPPFDLAAPPPGIYAISASVLWEAPLVDKGLFAWFRAREPDDRVGYSILIYEVPAP